jgi:hypothetical protein
MEAVSPAKASTPKREISPQRETLAGVRQEAEFLPETRLLFLAVYA